jgi:hypothetical protein
MVYRRTPVLATVAVLLARALAGQATPASAHPNDPSPVLKGKLRQLVVAEEKYWKDHGTYTTDVAALGMYSSKSVASDSVWVQVVQAGGRSWWGRSSHRSRRDLSCVIYVGATEDFSAPPVTDGTRAKAQREGEPVCDAF